MIITPAKATYLYFLCHAFSEKCFAISVCQVVLEMPCGSSKGFNSVKISTAAASEPTMSMALAHNPTGMSLV